MKSFATILLLAFVVVGTASGQPFIEKATHNVVQTKANWTGPDSTMPYLDDQGVRTVWVAQDLDKDGKPEILATDYSNSGRVHVFELVSGNTLELVWSSPRHQPSGGGSTPRWVRDGDLDGDGLRDADGVSAPFGLEDTGLDRMLGSEEDDELYGGTGLGFLYGNGGDDKLFRADGSLFESLDGGLLGEEWKEYARETGMAWYVGATDADDVITVDYVTEPGLLRDHHIVTRLTNNNGNYSFAAQVSLDFSALDENGDPIWDAEDLLIDLEQFRDRANQQDSPDPTQPSQPTLELAQVQYDLLNLEESLLPPEEDFDAIIVDAMDGNDQVYVGPTVQKTVWIDAGGGDDKVVISSGSSILVDRGEAPKRNDLSEYATLVADNPAAASPALTQNLTLKGLTMDNPNDVDWFRFTLDSDVTWNPADPGGPRILLSSASDLDGLTLELYRVNPDGSSSAAGTVALEVSQDATEQGAGHNSLATAYEFRDEEAIQNLFRIQGLTIHDGEDADYFSFTLTETGGEDDRIGLLKVLEGDPLTLEILNASGERIGEVAQKTAALALTKSLEGFAPGKYFIKVSSLAPARYELITRAGTGDAPDTAEDERRYLGNLNLDLSGKQSSFVDLTDVQAGDYLLKVASPIPCPRSMT